MSRPSRPPYEGTRTSFVISIDIGTTYSGASYTILRPNEVPEVYDVTGLGAALVPFCIRSNDVLLFDSYEGQEDRQANTKVPTVLYYDYSGGLVACGSQNRDEVAGRDDYIKVEWDVTNNIPFGGVADYCVDPVIDVFADFLRYMNRCVHDYICRTHVDGKTLWETNSHRTKYILSHPNGWEGAQQSQMRRAAAMAGLVPDSNSERIEFVSEGEASFHWCMEMRLLDVSSLTIGNRIVIADAGGGTIDVSSFKVTSLRPLKLAEASISDCRLAGSTFVTHTFKEALSDFAQNTELDDEEYIQEGVKDFDDRVKCTFHDHTKSVFIKIGSRRVNFPNLGVRSGQLKLLGPTVAAAFERSCEETVDAITQKLAGKTTRVFLVGGFAASPWLYSEVQRRLSKTGIEVMRADSHTAKAVAHGAVSFYIDRLIASRVTKHTYGISIRTFYKEKDPVHRTRRADVYTCNISGRQFIDGAFSAITIKGRPVPDDATYSCALSEYSKTREQIYGTMVLFHYTGILDNPEFFDMDESSFAKVCKIDYAIPASSLEKEKGSYGRYYIARYRVVLVLGKTELKSYTEWEENVSGYRIASTSGGADYVLRAEGYNEERPGDYGLGGELSSASPGVLVSMQKEYNTLRFNNWLRYSMVYVNALPITFEHAVMTMIHSLPLETIAEIVHLVLCKCDTYPETLHRLAQVCARWRDLILSHPPFWAIIDEAFGKRWAEWAVKRAKNVPLTFVYMAKSPRELSEVKAFVECLVQNIHRCRVLVVTHHWQEALGSLAILETVKQVLHTPDLTLESFALCMGRCASYRPLSSKYLLRIAHGTRQTRMMTIPIGMFRDGSPIARNLTHLKLFRNPRIDNTMGWDKPLHIEVLIDTLQACPTLISLELESIEIEGTLLRTVPTIHLPNLKHLELGYMATEAARALLPILDAPYCDILRLLLISDDTEPLGHVHDVLDASVIRAVCENMNKYSNTLNRVGAQVGSEPWDRIGISIIPTDLPGEFSLSLGGVEDQLRVFERIFSLLPDSVFSARQLDYSLSGHSPSVHSAFLRRFPLIDTITVDATEAQDDDWEAFFDTLTTPQFPDGEPAAWPALESLTVVASFDENCSVTFQLSPISKFIVDRIQILNEGRPGPRKFKKLHLKGICEGLDRVDLWLWPELIEDLLIQPEEDDEESG
ncbi:hypothetical protein FRB99_004079 [Tulasnella sp. 403]|nr:hypothetical protein FRB99_004079 [Tulasnella sp. 403]